MSILSGTIGSSILVDADHVSALIQKTGSAMLSASEVSMSIPVGFDLEGAIVRVRNIVPEISGQLEWAVQTGQMVEEGEIIAMVSNQDILAICDGWVVQHKQDKATQGESIGIIRTKASMISDQTIGEWRKYLAYWTKSDVSDLMPLREKAMMRRNSLFAVSRGPSVWQGLSPSSVIEADSDKWELMLQFIPKAINAVEAKKAAKAILSGEMPKTATPPNSDTEDNEDKQDNSDNSDGQDEPDTKEEKVETDNSSESNQGNSDNSDEKPKTEEEIRKDEALKKALAVKSMTNQAMELCDGLSKLVGKAQDAPRGDVWAVEELFPIMEEMDQSVRLILANRLLRSIGLDA